jgi:class 3 adenylate cyclase
MHEHSSASVHDLNEHDLRQVEGYAASRNTSVLVLFFTDMQGSSALKQRVTEVASEPLFHNTVKKEHDEIIREVITRDGSGAIIKDTGDGFFAVFAEPSTAVERALELQAVFHGHPYIAVRIGIDMGQVIVQSSGGVHRDLFGRHVDWASRAMSLADGATSWSPREWRPMRRASSTKPRCGAKGMACTSSNLARARSKSSNRTTPILPSRCPS